MKILLLAYFLCAWVSATSAAWAKIPWDTVTAGGVDGGGGVGVTCSDGSFELLDLHEIQLSGEELVASPDSQEEAIALVAKLFSSHFWNPDTIPVEQYIEVLREKVIRPIFAGEKIIDFSNNQEIDIQFGPKLSLSLDVGNYTLRPGCSLEQVAYFDDVHRIIKIHLENWQRLSWRDKAALVAHELVYFVDRRDGLENVGTENTALTSERARGFIGRLFTRQGLTPKAGGMPESKFLFQCSNTASEFSELTYFYFFEEGPNQVRFIFNAVHGKDSPYQMSSQITGLKMESLLSSNAPIDTGGSISFTDQPLSPSFFFSLRRDSSRRLLFRAYLLANEGDLPVGRIQELVCQPF